MKTITNGNKSVEIIKQGDSFFCLYCQNYKELDQTHSEVLDTKRYETEKNAVKWANKQLGIN